MANEGLVVVVSYNGIRGGWGRSSRIEASTEEEEIRGVDAGILGRQIIVVIGCQLSVVSGRQVGRIFWFRGQGGAPAYTLVILEHVFGGILRYFEIICGILGHFWSFWGIFGHFGGILGRFWTWAFSGIASR